MLPVEHSAILLTFIKLPFVIKIFVLSILVAVLHRFYCTFQKLYIEELLLLKKTTNHKYGENVAAEGDVTSAKQRSC